MGKGEGPADACLISAASLANDATVLKHSDCWRAWACHLQSEVAAHASHNQDVWGVAVRHGALGDLHQHRKDGLLHTWAQALQVTSLMTAVSAHMVHCQAPAVTHSPASLVTLRWKLQVLEQLLAIGTILHMNH